jgi:hypothetical protein
MTKIDYDLIADEWDSLPTRTPVRGNTNPTGSLTDNRRIVKSQRDGAIKRLRQLKEASNG